MLLRHDDMYSAANLHVTTAKNTVMFTVTAMRTSTIAKCICGTVTLTGWIFLQYYKEKFILSFLKNLVVLHHKGKGTYEVHLRTGHEGPEWE